LKLPLIITSALFFLIMIGKNQMERHKFQGKERQILPCLQHAHTSLDALCVPTWVVGICVWQPRCTSFLEHILPARPCSACPSSHHPPSRDQAASRAQNPFLTFSHSIVHPPFRAPNEAITEAP
jgi:hypothetical protein